MSYLEKARRQGPCLICEPGSSARHRLWDAVDCGLRIDGMTPEQAARNWALDVGEVRWIRDAYASARKAHRPLPGRRVFA